MLETDISFIDPLISVFFLRGLEKKVVNILPDVSNFPPIAEVR